MAFAKAIALKLLRYAPVVRLYFRAGFVVMGDGR